MITTIALDATGPLLESAPTVVAGSGSGSPAVTADVAGAVNDVRFGLILAGSVAAASLVFFLGVGLPMWWFTGEIWDGIGLGAFTAFWGGPGFGVMGAGAIWGARSKPAARRSERAARRSEPAARRSERAARRETRPTR